MVFKVIHGKRKSREGQKKIADTKAEQLKYFVSHMRTLEGSISSIKTMAVKLEWDELNKRLISCHKHILDTLSYVKRETSKVESDKLKLATRPIFNKEHLKEVTPKDESPL